MTFAAFISSGKDSLLALDRAQRSGMSVSRVVNIYDHESERVKFHGVRAELVRAQAQALDIPLTMASTAPNGTDYEQVFMRTLRALSADNIEGIIFGNIHLTDVRDWFESRITAMGIAHIEPLWGEQPDELVHELLDRGYTARIVSVDLGSAPASWLGRPISEPLIEEMVAHGIDLCGENGEYHTFVENGPLFSHPVICKVGPTVSTKTHAMIDLQLG